MGGQSAGKSNNTSGSACAMNSVQRQQLEELCPSVQWQVNMAAHSSLRAGGTVEALVEIRDSSILPALIRWLNKEKLNWQALGGGSNILFTSGQHPGLCIRLKGGLEDINYRENLFAGNPATGKLVQVHAGVSMVVFLAWCLREELSGLECMAGIPGTVGGAVAMNAGAFGGTVGERLAAVECINASGAVMEVPVDRLAFQYRRTIFPGDCSLKYMITSATFALQPDSGAVIKKRMGEITAQRKTKQPGAVASAGSFFKNPPGDYAGRLIEQAGLKGYRHGEAMVSLHHGNFIINRGGASPEDILGLMHFIQQRVLDCCGIMLEPEVRIIEPLME